MKIKIFGSKNLLIGTIERGDLKKIKDFQVFINSLVEEDAKILMNEKATLKDEEKFISDALKGIKNKSKIFIIAKDGNKIAGNTSIERQRWKRSHVGSFAIAIDKEYRGIGLGKYLMSEVIKSARKGFSPGLKIIQLGVLSNNHPAIALYKKMGFQIVAKLPKQIQYKGKLINEYIMVKYL